MAERVTLPEVLGDRNGPRAWVGYGVYRAVTALATSLPDRARRAIAGAAASLGQRLDRRHTDAARRFLAQALGDQVDREAYVRAAWRHLMDVVLEEAAFNRRVLPDLTSHFDLEISDAARQAAAAGNGGFFVVPHLGMWEAMPAIGARLGFAPAFVVSRPPRNRPLSRFVMRTREARGYRLIHRRGAIEGVKAAISAGGWVGLMLDQRARGKTILAPFFGRVARCERTIPVLVRRLGRPVVFGACYRTERPFHYRAVIGPVLWPDQLTSLDAVGVATAINREMEALIRRAPEQYLWLHDRYREAPR